MTDHYAEAERLIAKYHEVEQAVRDGSLKMLEAGVSQDAAAAWAVNTLPGIALILQEAQVHATLATGERSTGDIPRSDVPAASTDLVDQMIERLRGVELTHQQAHRLRVAIDLSDRRED